MGDGLIRYYQTKLKKEYKIAFFSTLVISLLIHLYKFTNTLPNYDSLYNYYSDQNILASGRWALSLACGISSFYDLPWVNGLLSCVYIALTVVVIVAIFKLKNPVLIGLTGALLAASPATTETFFFEFTADGYMLAMLLAALAVYFSRIDEKRVSRWILSGILICVSCGIYQAYVSFALILAVCYFMDDLFQNRHSKQESLKWVLRQAIIYIVALAAYYIIWKLCMRFTGTVANDYQGISSVGTFSLGLLLQGLPKTIESTLRYFLQWNVLEYGFTLYSVLSVIFLLSLAVGLVIACKKSKIFSRKWAVVLLALCLVAIIPFACIWHFVSREVAYRAIMLQSLTLLFVFAAVLYERWAKPHLKNIVAVLLLVIVFTNSLMANICYYYMHLCYEKTYAEAVEMLDDIHDMQDEYDFDKIAIIGTLYREVWLDDFDPETGAVLPAGEIHILSTLMKHSLFFDSDHITRFLEANFGFKMECLTQDERNELLSSEKCQAMECWPKKSSMAVIDGVLVIKLSETAEWWW